MPDVPHNKHTHMVETSPRTELVEQQFNSLGFEHRIRIATATLIKKAVKDKHDLRMHVVVADSDGENATFEITVVLKEVE